ncbi:helix-turn-helix domain-containing protein [Streptacidiphilus sp. N1-3]|uniref:Helix-turn-helix domain-containing protein n=1 Tax=Streptacidiphilus alkalitolerans TaxID=3342712 RepID=A0ABV6X7L3_9ACTN
MTTTGRAPVALRSLLRPDGSVVVPPDIADEVLRVLILGLDARVRADGGELSPSTRRFLYALHESSQLPRRTASTASGTPLSPVATVELTTEQAAALLECIPRYVRRLAATGRIKARHAGRAWLIDAASLDAYRTGSTTPCP